jgi:hypothetical protein
MTARPRFRVIANDLALVAVAYDTPMRYGEKVLASRGAMARAAKSQGRA